MNNSNENLMTEIQNRYKYKKIYTNRHKYVPLDEKYDLKKEDIVFIQTRVDILYSEIANKYSVKESEVYDKLYLKVRKLFLEMM